MEGSQVVKGGKKEVMREMVKTRMKTQQVTGSVSSGKTKQKQTRTVCLIHSNATEMLQHSENIETHTSVFTVRPKP